MTRLCARLNNRVAAWSAWLETTVRARVAVLRLIGAVVVAVLALPAPARSQAGVQVLDAGSLLELPERRFDLTERTLRFTPSGQGYLVAFVDLNFDNQAGTAVGDGTRVPLPFAFPFANQTFDYVYVNLNGNVSFDHSETSVWPQRDPWADGTMRSVAAALDTRAAAGAERMIAVLWAIYGAGTVQTVSRGDVFLVTWRVTRPVPVTSFYDPLGPNAFQLRLFPSGVIEFSYQTVSELDGIVGVFRGLSDSRTIIDSVSEPGDAPDSTVDIVRFDVIDTGSTLIASFEMGADVPASINTGSSLFYRFFVEINGRRCSVELGITSAGRRPATANCLASPQVSGALVQGRRVELYLSRTALQERPAFSWAADVVWFGIPGRFDQINLSNPRAVTIAAHATSIDLSAASGPLLGNAFEVFHYPALNKRLDAVTRSLYSVVPPIDDMAVVFTDFRIDDLYNHGGSSGALNVPIQGIGPLFATPASGTLYGSSTLQVAISPLFVGGPRLRANPAVGLRNHAYAVWWIAHELVHRWAAALRMRHPITGTIESLTSGSCGCHWAEWLHLPVLHPVWAQFADHVYFESSPMGGALLEEQPDGSFVRRFAANQSAAGLSALDLYVMGLVAPEEVPETFVLQNPVRVAPDRYTGTKVPVRLADIVSAEGPRVPASGQAQKQFRLGMYLLRQPGRAADPDMLARAQAIRANLVEYFATATGHRLRLLGSPVSPTLTLIGGASNPITLRWSSVPGASSYTLHVGTQPGGSNFGVFSMGLSTSVTAPVPLGTRLFMRVVVATEEGDAISNEIVVALMPPGPPQLSVVQALSNPVSFAWVAGIGGTPSQYFIQAGSTSGASNLGTLSMGSATALSVAAPAGLPIYVRVLAVNAFGSAISNEVSFTVGRGTLTAPVMNAPSVNGSTVALSWTTGSGTNSQSYLVKARLTASGPVIASLQSSSPMLTVSAVPPGTYYVSVVAIDGGLMSPESNQVVVSVR